MIDIVLHFPAYKSIFIQALPLQGFPLMSAGCVLGRVGPADPELGPPGGPSFGSVFCFGNSNFNVFDSPRPQRSHFGVRLADPKMGPSIQNLLAGGAARRPQF